jgi:hypothetical protein
MHQINQRDLVFWSTRFSEHCLFLIKLMFRLHRNDPGLLKGIETLRADWDKVTQNPQLFSDKLIGDTRYIKQRARTLLDNNKCLPDLVQHMREELNYFTDSVVDQQYSLQDEVVYWASEHSESLGFVACQLPILVKDDNDHQVELSSQIQNLLKDSQKLKKEFEELSSRSRQGVFPQLTRLFSRQSHVLTMAVSILMRLKSQYIRSIDTLLDFIDQGELPLKPGTQAMLVDMVNHEKNEAKWSEQRIRYLYQQTQMKEIL